jgi:hypothetical protein
MKDLDGQVHLPAGGKVVLMKQMYPLDVLLFVDEESQAVVVRRLEAYPREH